MMIGDDLHLAIYTVALISCLASASRAQVYH
jgi:hypothetical protein